MTGEIDDEHGEPFIGGFGLFKPVDDVGVVDDRR